MKEFYVFLQVLKAFIEWATSTELQDLNFMVPEDERVQNIMQIRMQSPGGKLDALLPRALNLCMKTTDVRQFAYAMAHKDAAFIDQCKSSD